MITLKRAFTGNWVPWRWRAAALLAAALLGAAGSAQSQGKWRFAAPAFFPLTRGIFSPAGMVAPDGSKTILGVIQNIGLDGQRPELESRHTHSPVAPPYTLFSLQVWQENPQPRPMSRGPEYRYGAPWNDYLAMCAVVADREGDRIAVLEPRGDIHILRSNFSEVTTIPAPFQDFNDGRIRDIAVSPRGDRVAVLIYIPTGSQVRMYDAADGAELWRHVLAAGDPQHVAFSADGTMIAWTRLQLEHAGRAAWLSPFPGPNLFVEAAGDGKVLTSIATADAASWVCFGAGGRVYTAPAYLAAPQSPPPKLGHTAIKIWDAASGRLIGDADCPGRGVHDAIALSPDGSTLFGNVSRPTSMDWLDGNRTFQPADCVVAAWDALTGRLLAVSSNLNHRNNRIFWPRLAPWNGGVLVTEEVAAPVAVHLEPSH